MIPPRRIDMAVRQTTQVLFDALVLDTWPSNAALVDFGLDGWGGTDAQAVYRAYQTAVKHRGVTVEQLDSALGDGKRLTALVGTTVKTVWDEM